MGQHNMVSKTARRIRCEDVLKSFSKDRMSFFTFTTPDVVTYETIRERWRNLRHHIVRKYKNHDLKYVMNFELHPKGHGWHIHCVFNDFINLRFGGIEDIRRFGFGIVNVQKVNSLGVAQYLSKHCLKAYRGVRQAEKGNGKRLRLVNTSRGLPRLSDYEWHSEFLKQVRGFVRRPFFKCRFSNIPFALRYSYAQIAVLNGWDVEQLWKCLCGRVPADVVGL